MVFFFKRLPSQDTNAFSESFYGRRFSLPLFLLLLTHSDRLAPYCISTFLAGTHNYLAGIHNYFFAMLTMTTVHHGLPLGGWFCTISFLFWSVLPTQLALSASTGLRSYRAWPLLRCVCGKPLSGLCYVCFLFFLCSDDRAMGFPDSSCLFFDLIPFVYLLS